MFILQKNSFTYTLVKNQKTSAKMKIIKLVNNIQISGFRTVSFQTEIRMYSSNYQLSIINLFESYIFFFLRK